MKLSTLVKNCIINYPTLFVKETLEDSILNVYCHLFNVLGNGCRMAKTQDPKQGGYMVNCSDFLEDGEFDRPYSSFEENFITDSQFEKLKLLHNCKRLPEYALIELYEKNTNKIIKRSKMNFKPYPYFDFELNYILCAEFLQGDYKNAAIYYWDKVREYFSNEDNYCSYYHYPNDFNVNREIYRLKSKDTEITDVEEFTKNLMDKWNYETLPEIRVKVEKIINHLKS